MRCYRLQGVITRARIALGVALVGAALATVLFVRASQTESPIQAYASSAAAVQEAAPAGGRPTAMEDTALSTRGGRGPIQAPLTTTTADAPTPTPTDIPQTTVTLSPISLPTPEPAPVHGQAQTAPLRVGLQAGHWKTSELPAELAGLRGSTGAAGDGWREVDVTVDIARRVAALLQEENVVVDLMPATVAAGYKADAFVTIHGDANANPSISGYKLARSTRSSIPAKDDALLQAISSEYGAATGLKFHEGSITLNMTAYYAFANWGIAHSAASTTPSVILELGFLTTPDDRQILTGQPDRVAEGIAKGMMRFLRDS